MQGIPILIIIWNYFLLQRLVKNLKTIRSPLFYVGDKKQLISQMLQYFPKNICNFYEPFVGGGTVFMNTKAQQYFLNDIDAYIIGIHKMLIEKLKTKSVANFLDDVLLYARNYDLSRSFYENIIPDELKKANKKTYYSKYNKKGYNKLREDYNKSNRMDFFVLYLLLIYGFNRMIRFNGSGNFNLPVGNVDFNTNVRKALEYYGEKIRNVKMELFNLDYKKFLKKFTLNNDDFVYFDPPYLISGSEYNKLWSKNDEKELLELLDELNAKGIRFALSNVFKHKGRENTLLIDWAVKYNVHYLNSNYISYHDNTIKKDTIEVLILNY
ncbi:MAG: Dam family site-specific DNA-(adenine-N6)-methyltransferase [Tenericutes bacterium]|nr:Dam family site-specific DNA-(adenine-N6)-methyltransferase [Mycoplasmatota bacterium]